MKIFTKNEIHEALHLPTVIEAIEQGFVLFSKQEAVIPPVGTLNFTDPPGECHIKYGYTSQSPYYVIKVASGFYENPKIGLPSSNGVMLLFDKKNGTPLCLLADEGYLTDIRTAVAGCIAAKYLAPKDVECIGIVGTGMQAYYQLKLLNYATACKRVCVWGRDHDKVKQFCSRENLKEFEISAVHDLDELTSRCNLIVTTTPATKALLFADQIQPGTHITAMGADSVGKQEIDPLIFAKAERVVVDSRKQCAHHGDSAHALALGLIQEHQLVELGEMIARPSLGRKSDKEITLADLTGVAVQDLQIASTVYELLKCTH